MKKTLSLLLSLALVLSLVPALGITAGATGKPSVTYRYYDTDAKEFKENTVSEYTLIAEDASTLVTWTAGTYVVGKDYNEDGVIDSADVTYAKAQEPELPFTFTYSAGAKVEGDVKLILCAGFTLKVTNSTEGEAGILVTGTGNSLTVYGQTETGGTLAAQGGLEGAGIGGGNGQPGSHITIHSGKVNATGRAGGCGAGIGGGSLADGSDITIYGGTITAQGGTAAAGIGGGGSNTAGKAAGSGKNIAVYGGTVTATGSNQGAAGIGGGYAAKTGCKGGDGADIIIYGGVVTAKSPTKKDGTGGGYAIGGGKSKTAGNEGSSTVKIAVELYIKNGDEKDLTAETAVHSTALDTDSSALVAKHYASIRPLTFMIGEEKYGFWEDMLAAAKDGGKTVKLMYNYNFAATTELPENTTLALNDHKLAGSSGCTLSGTGLKFAIVSETDMNNAVALAKNCLEQTWELQNNIALQNRVSLSGIETLTFNGNGFTITGADDAVAGEKETECLLTCGGKKADSEIISQVTMNNLTVKTNNKFQRCIYIQRNTNTQTNTVRLTLNNVTVDNSVCSTDRQGCCIVSNSAYIVLQGKCSFITGKYSWSAIDLDKSTGDASLTFDNGAEVSFVDGRTDAEKSIEPIIDFDGESETYKCEVINAEAAGLIATDHYGKQGYDFYGSYTLLQPVQEGKFELMLNDTNAGVYVFTKKDNGFVLQSGEGYLQFDSFSRRLTTTDEAEDATVWQYNGGLYVDIKTGRCGHGGFFRTPRNIRYYLAASSYGQPYARLNAACAKTAYTAYVNYAPVQLTCQDDVSYTGVLPHHCFRYTVENAPANAGIEYSFGYSWGMGSSFTTLYKPSTVWIRVNDGKTMTLWKATLRNNVYTMCVVE